MYKSERLKQVQQDAHIFDRWAETRDQGTIGNNLGVKCGNVRIKNVKFKKFNTFQM